MQIIEHAQRWLEGLTQARGVDRVHELDMGMVRAAQLVIGLMARYFRCEVFGLEKVPNGRAILVGNHNGGITSCEPLILGLRWYEHTAYREPLHFLAHDAMLALPALGDILLRLGAIRASHTTANLVLQNDRKVFVFPGGNYEAFRPYWQRYRVDFHRRTGYVRLALRNRAPLVPVLCFGGHGTFCVLSRGERLSRWTGAKKYLRSDAFPLFLGLPWGVGVGPIFHLPLPRKLIVEVGDPVPVDTYDPHSADDPAVLRELGDKVQARVQAMMDRRAAERRSRARPTRASAWSTAR